MKTSKGWVVVVVFITKAALLTAAFVILRVLGVIAWPWLWVLSPGLVVVVGLAGCLILSILYAVGLSVLRDRGR